MKQSHITYIMGQLKEEDLKERGFGLTIWLRKRHSSRTAPSTQQKKRAKPPKCKVNCYRIQASGTVQRQV
ncbi:hypothetical protein J6590_098165, partial [Homalodisca vitripennis]